MKLKKLGNSITSFSEIGLGTWKLIPDSVEVPKAAAYLFEKGVNFIDTAEMYQNESELGSMLKTIKHEPFIATKVSPNHLHYSDVIKSCNESLSRLGVSQITLYQIHWPNHRINLKETIRAMEYLVEQGKIKYIGVSNFDQKELEEAMSYTKNSKIVSDQLEYNIAFTEVEDSGLLDFCKSNNVSVIAYSPLARGQIKNYTELYGVLSSIGEKYNSNAFQVALKYIISDEDVIAIPKISSMPHAEEIIGCEEFEISQKDISRIKEAARDIRKPLAGSSLKKILKANGSWAKLMEKHERSRINRGGKLD